MKKPFTYFAIFIIPIYFGFILFDAYLIMSKNTKGLYVGWIDSIPESDMREKWEVVVDLRKSGTNAQISSHPNKLKVPLKGEDGNPLIPLGGVSNIMTVLCNETGQYVNFKSDEKGFNNPSRLFNKKVQLVTLGDSYTQGSCPPLSQHMVSIIREYYPLTVNLGSLANGPLINLASLMEYGPHLKPDVVLWFHYEGNDFKDMTYELSSPFKRNYLKDDFSQDLFYRQTEIDKVLGKFLDDGIKERETKNNTRRVRFSLSNWDKLIGVALLRSFRQWIKWTYFSKPEKINADYNQFRAILSKVLRLLDTWNGKLVFVYLPQMDLEFYGIDIKNQKINVEYYVKSLKIDFLDVKLNMNNNGGVHKFFYRPGSHYNEDGNRLIAKLVLDHLKSKNLISYQKPSDE